MLQLQEEQSLKTVRWVGSVREEQIRKAVFGRRRRAKKPSDRRREWVGEGGRRRQEGRKRREVARPDKAGVLSGR
ncbi:MAG: hypothetical protein DMG57_26670 [Acidobacteria bacterium]|nr:MAG: hypothetical protein DMG57_26670 [Acidobacteriota bacterium]